MNWPEIQNSTKGLEWRFFPPRASSFAGIIEICVGLFKRSLKRAMQFDRGLKTPRRFDLEQFRTLCLEAAALTNDRPLGVQPWDREEGRDSLTHVSPNKLISGRASQIVPVNLTVREAIHQGMNISIIYKHRTKVLRLFWNEFRANYLRSLKFTPKWFQVQ